MQVLVWDKQAAACRWLPVFLLHHGHSVAYAPGADGLYSPVRWP